VSILLPGAGPGGPDDDLLAALLIRMWALASGRSLPRNVPAAQLSEEELINFWADDMSPPAGRHATPGKLDRATREQIPAKADRSPRRPRGRADRASLVRIAGSQRERPVDPAAA
jgi:hypothetical protein